MPFAALILFVLGFLLATEVRFVGLLFAGEVLLLPVAVLSFAFAVRDMDTDVLKFTGWFGFSVLAYIAADLINGTEVTNALRAWARLGFALVIFLAMRLILSRSRFNLLPVCVGMLVGYFALKYDLKTAEFWKFYAAPVAVSSGLYLVAWFSRRFVHLFSCLFLCLAAVWFFYIDARAGSAICLIISGWIAARTVGVKRIRGLLPVLLAGGVLIAGVAIYFGLTLTSDTKGERRAGSNDTRLSSVILAVEIIAEHPWVGIGSSTMTSQESDRLRQLMGELGQSNSRVIVALGEQTQLLQACTEAGIFAGLAMVYYLWRLLSALRWMLWKPIDRLYSVELYFLTFGLTTFVVGGLNGPSRIYVALNMCICVALAQQEKIYNRELARRRHFQRQTAIDGFRQGLPVAGAAGD